MRRLTAPVFTQISKRLARVAFLAPQSYRHRHAHGSVHFRVPALVPGSQPRLARTRNRRLATSVSRPAAATPRPPFARLRRTAALGLALPDLAEVLNVMVLVKPATVLAWHRKGFRLYWRRRSRPLGRPGMNREIRELIRKMSRANPLWGAPRIHGELLKLGFELSQATVGRYMPWRHT